MQIGTKKAFVCQFLCYPQTCDYLTGLGRGWPAILALYRDQQQQNSQLWTVGMNRSNCQLVSKVSNSAFIFRVVTKFNLSEIFYYGTAI